MQVLSQFVYPVKSLRGIALPEMALDEFGPAGDRRWMIVDAEGQFVTQRSHPRLALIHTALVRGEVVIDVPGHGAHTLEPGHTTRPVRVWQDWVKAGDAAGSASEALSGFIGESLTLVHMPDATFREVKGGRVTERRRVGFADGFPFLIVNQASLDDLNSRLDNPVDIRRFRPNLVIEGAEAWQEDLWRQLRIGDVVFDLVKPCSRCVMTTVDPDLGTKAADAQPLRTLGRFRRTPDGVMFGINALHRPEGVMVRRGDPVEILQQES